MDELIIAVGLNENVMRDQNPNVPITPATPGPARPR